MRKTVLTSLCFFALFLTGFGKDGPFPLDSSVGVWKAKSNPSAYVTIEVEDIIDNLARVYVEMTNEKKEVIAEGRVVYDMKQPKFIAIVVTNNGSLLSLVMKAVYPKGLEPSPTNLSLATEIKYIGGGQVTHEKGYLGSTVLVRAED